MVLYMSLGTGVITMKITNKLLPIIAIASLSACTTVSNNSEEDIAKLKFDESNYQSMFHPVIESVTKMK